MYSQIFVLARRYHSPGSPERRFAGDDVSVHTCAIAQGCFFVFFPPTLWEGWNSFRGPTPSSPASSAVRLLRLSLPYSTRLNPHQTALLFFFLDPRFSILVSGRRLGTLSVATSRSATPTTLPAPSRPWKSIVRGAGATKSRMALTYVARLIFFVKAWVERRR